MWFQRNGPYVSILNKAEKLAENDEFTFTDDTLAAISVRSLLGILNVNVHHTLPQTLVTGQKGTIFAGRVRISRIQQNSQYFRVNLFCKLQSVQIGRDRCRALILDDKGNHSFFSQANCKQI